MNGSHPARRARVARVLAAVALALAAGAAVLMLGRGPVAAAVPAGAQAVLVARSAGGHDALWLVSPADGSATAAGTLPGVAGSAAVSPDGANVVYLPASGAPHLWLGYGALAPKNISLVSAGLRTVDAMTWISDARLLVSGQARGTYAGVREDRLFVVNVQTGHVGAFRGLSGAEPSADANLAKIVYVKFTKLDDGSASNGHSPLYREALKLLRLDRSGAGRTLASEQYRLFTDQRAFSRPALAPGAEWVLAGVTGSDVRVTYSLYDTSGIGVPWLSVYAPSLQAAAWAPDGHAVAFGGAPASSSATSEASVFVYDVASGALTRTPKGLLAGKSFTMITDVAWSSDGRIVARTISDTVTLTHHVFVMSGTDLGSIKDLGTGHAPLWVP